MEDTSVSVVGDESEFISVHCFVTKFFSSALSGAVTGIFALAGAFTGAIAGALASRGSDNSLLRGAGLGAVAGAVLSVEVLEASRAYWFLQQSGSQSSSSMADFLEEFLHGRFVEEQLPSSVLTGYYWQQANIANVIYDDIYDINGDGSPRGLSMNTLKKLPCHIILDINKTTTNICCPICLQDYEVGESARSLPRCSHTFHQKCVDKWLIQHGSCPICRRHI